MDEDSEGSAEPFGSQLAQRLAGHMPDEDVGQEVRQYETAPAAGAAPSGGGDEDARAAVRKVPKAPSPQSSLNNAASGTPHKLATL